MSGFLNPQVNPQAQTLTVGTMMQQPARITERISRLAADQIILDKIFHTTGQKVTGGAMLFNVVNIEDFFTENDVEQRAPSTRSSGASTRSRRQRRSRTGAASSGSMT